jgi:D-alanyl-lipoteichoic acid acyltransferase DltB (MBOAT superfamily)
MQTGVRIGPMFDAPLLARSPRDFWSRRWNLAFRNLMHRLVFEPIRARGFPRLGVALVFALSAAIHEYLVVAALGRTRGHMTAFFLLHGLATLADGTLARLRGGRRLLPRPLAIAAHLVWFLATTPLFFAPVLEIYSVHRWRLW